MFVVFIGRNDVIITTKQKEAETVRAYFTPGGRVREEYNRQESGEGAVAVEFRPVAR